MTPLQQSHTQIKTGNCRGPGRRLAHRARPHEFAVVHSYLATAHKWGKDKYHALTELFITGPWLPPILAPS